MKTVYFVQSFTQVSNGKSTRLQAEPPTACATAEAAQLKAEKLSDKRAGVIAIAQEYDADSDDYGKLTVLAKYGDIPDGAMGES